MSSFSLMRIRASEGKVYSLQKAKYVARGDASFSINPIITSGIDVNTYVICVLPPLSLSLFLLAQDVKGANFAARESCARVLFAYAFASTSSLHRSRRIYIRIHISVYKRLRVTARRFPLGAIAQLRLSFRSTREAPQAREFRRDVNHVFIVHGFASARYVHK